jgi:WD40 repeat protein/DNA-binding SARP family transcriptional activator/class 3 adenylate cyclase/energy-coupling factor transporter ATP-binding protein EcfA2
VDTAGGRVATWTVLFTDMVGSTERRVRVGEDVFDRVRADLDRRIERAVRAHDGAEVKSTGDGIMAGFAATASALRCAVAIQAAVAAYNREAADDLALRVGISVGDAAVEDSDLQGTAVIEAARLCDVAEPDTILCSDAVRSVSANRSGCTFGEPRSVDLKGLPGPVVTYEVIAAPPGDRSDGRGLTFRVLGPLEAQRDGRGLAVGGPKERLVLAVLLAAGGTCVSIDALADAIWGERPPRTAERTVHAYIARLRRALEPGQRPAGTMPLIETVGRAYRLRIEPDQLDSGRFEERARTGTEQLGRGEPAAAADALRAALAEWRGEAYAGFADVERCAAEATRLDALRLGAAEDRVDADLAAGGATALVPELEAAVAEQPFRERRWTQLMLALYRSGRQRDALDAYHRVRRALVNELGIEPGPELRRLEAAILDQDPALDEAPSHPRPTGPTGLPLALAAVGSAFVGRDREVAWLRSAWVAAAGGQGGFVSVLGPEGAGKTRLVAEVARESHGDGAVVLYGRCDHAHRGAPALVDQALGSAGGSIGQLDQTAAGADLATAVARHLPAWAGGRPVMLVLDDLHLADAETLEFVADLAGWCRAERLLAVGVFRNDGPVPGEADRGAATEDGSRLVLGPLQKDDVAGICRIYEPDGWTAEDVEQVAELSGGIPLLVHEHASSLARDRAARRIEQAAGRLAASRGRLLTFRGEVADGVETIQRLLEQRRAQLAGRQAQFQAQAVASLAGCPYKGLARFEAADADNFFGRERLVAELLARVPETSLVAVVGPSGSGKSSLLRAGLLPALAGGVLEGTEPWRTVALCPGTRPTQELATRLRDLPAAGGQPRAVLVDQFEETFTLGASPDEQTQFIDRLLALSREPATAVVLAVRADHLGGCAAHPELAARLAGNDVLVGPMRDSELRRTVELPAQRAGLEIEPGLVEVIVGDVAGRSGALPLLSTALAETWERRQSRRLTLAGYRAAGGVNGALARVAEDGYAAIPTSSRPAARRILLRLCDVGEDAALDVRRRLPLSDVVDDNDADSRAALDALADRRLLTVDGDTVEVAHESLLREWPRLRTWLEEDVEGRRLHRRLGDTARTWEADSRDPFELYRGTQLDAATTWADGHADALNRTERAFLDASTAERDAERRREAARVRRLRALLTTVAVALVVSLVAGAVALGQRDRASDRGRLAEARELAAAANANLDVDPERSILLALEAVDRSRSDGEDKPGGSALPEAEEALHSAIAATRVRLRVPGVGGSLDWSPRGDVFVAEHPDQSGVVDIRDARTGESLRTYRGHDVDLTDVVFNGDGSLLATGGDDGAARIWDPDTGEELHEMDFRGGDEISNVLAPSFSPDGRLFAAAWFDEGVVRVLDLASGHVVQEIRSVTRPRATSFDPSGTRLVVSSFATPTVAVVDVASGRELFTLPGLLNSAIDVDWSPDGTSIAAALPSDDSARVFDAHSGVQRLTLVGDGSGLLELDWRPDGTGLVTGSLGGTVALWQVTGTSGRRLATLSSQDTRTGVNGLAFSPDGTQLMAGNLDVPATTVWDVSIAGDAEVANLPARPYVAGAVGYALDGRFLVAPSSSGLLNVWDARDLTIERTLGVDGAGSPVREEVALDRPLSLPPSTTGPTAGAVDVHPDGLIAAAVYDTVRVWDAATGQGGFTISLEASIYDVAWSPIGDMLAVTAGTATSAWVTVIDRSGRRWATLQAEPGAAFQTVAFTPDGERIVMARVPNNETDPPVGGVVAWDWRRDQAEELVDTFASAAVVDPTGRLVATESGRSGSQVVELWDAASGNRVAALPGHTASVTDMVFGPDGSRLATATEDGTVRVWDPESGEELVVLRGHDAVVGSVAFSPDGARLASVAADGLVRVWTLDVDELVEIAQRELTRTLTDAECQQYLHTERCRQA